jgi:alkylhydroperoxidase family enzyme
MAIDDAGWTGTSGRAAFVRAEPELAGLWQQLESGFWHATRPDLADLVRRATVAVTGLPALPVPAVLVDRRPVEAWRTAPDDFTADERTVLDFAEQFAADVSATTDAQRAALAGALGDDTFGFVQLLYVADFAPRVRAALDALFGPSAPAPEPTSAEVPTVDLWPLLERFITIVGPLDAIDVVTRELVRLRGARQHQCRLCQSLRNRSAIVAGADDAMFDAVDHADGSVLTERQQAALGLVDAIIWQPARIDEATAAAVRRTYSPLEAVHLVLNVARNSIQKVPVALATDGANVTDGVEIYDLNADGSLSYGLAAPVG